MNAWAKPGQLGMSVPPGELQGRSAAEMNAELDDYVRLGVDWVRMDLQWSFIQPNRAGGYVWDAYDRLIGGVEARGMKLVGVLDEMPRWVRDDMSSHADREAFADFAEAAVRRYGSVQHWEVVNEPNMHNITPENYTALLKTVNARIEAVDPGDVVITGGTAAVPYDQNGLYGAVEYLERMYAAGAKGHFDAVGYHPYTYPLMPSDPAPWNGWEMMEQGIRPTMVANGDGAKQVWMTELGAPTWGRGDAVPEWKQTAILEEAVALARGYAWAGPIMWYSYEDRGGGGSTENYFGMLREDGSRKGIWDAFAALGAADGGVGGGGGGGGTRQQAVASEAPGLLLRGRNGDDALRGGTGDDVLVGGRGNDVLTGGGGRDVFRFEGRGFGWDRITDFGEGDRIDLAGVDAQSGKPGNQSFRFVGPQWLDDPSDLGVYVDRSRDVTSVQGDFDGDGRFDFSIVLDGLHRLDAADFVL